MSNPRAAAGGYRPRGREKPRIRMASRRDG